jgi:hypothetical protein
MELKDVILSTLNEIDSISDQVPVIQKPDKVTPQVEKKPEQSVKNSDKIISMETSDKIETLAKAVINTKNSQDEEKFLLNVKERLLVLFEGFQSPNNVEIDAKIDMTLNFLEYLLATIESRVETIEEDKKKSK